MALIPDWLKRDAFDKAIFDLPASLPDMAPAALREIAEAFSQSLTVPASQAACTAILGELRLLTKVRNENVEEARARFRLLREHLKDVPEDILREARNAYARSNRFFPDGPAEILPYIDRIRLQRARTAHMLRRLAREAEYRLAEQKRLEALTSDPLTPETAAAIMREYNIRPAMARCIAPAEMRRTPTPQDYLDMGVDPSIVEHYRARSLRGVRGTQGPKPASAKSEQRQ